ncbi:hypothetical protein C9374_000031 [Naegleria lovaniensis]|uniref:EF-hand domain-containing protein n=1 Tax=Naegleria lovaniensis TaxID=51637 RepID=A0AA88GWY3_NAELO|nr:uncharacterized protein C9374_000031 [Naegleria lovaniensis]KAG2388592.1 hypothetical protein C9374_000031 [Naegleria lovaniensis]
MSSTQKLTPQQLEEIRRAFKQYDKDNSNSIDRQELQTLLETTLKTNLSEKMLQKYVDVQFNKNDTNKNQVIDYDEFVKLYTTLYFSPELPISMRLEHKSNSFRKEPLTSSPSNSVAPPLPQKKPLSEEEKRKAKQCFDKYDLDKSGTIDRNEMSKLLESVYNENGKMSKVLFNRLVDMHMNKAGDDNVFSFEEFLGIYRNIFGEDQDVAQSSSGFVLPGM